MQAILHFALHYMLVYDKNSFLKALIKFMNQVDP